MIKIEHRVFEIWNCARNASIGGRHMSIMTLLSMDAGVSEACELTFGPSYRTS